MSDTRPIGVMDSGLGGISVLREAIQLLPHEDFIYFGDSHNAPYGTKSDLEILQLTRKVVEKLLAQNVKAVLLACNTATSVAINDLRQEYTLPIIGIEPAVKPAAELSTPTRKILVLATPATLKRDKFSNLVQKLHLNDQILAQPCPGLVELIEAGHCEDALLEEYLHNNLSTYLKMDISVIVLGCTHYPFIKNKLQDFFGGHVAIVDGSVGTSKQLLHKLQEHNLLTDSNSMGRVIIQNSSESALLQQLSQQLLHYK